MIRKFTRITAIITLIGCVCGILLALIYPNVQSMSSHDLTTCIFCLGALDMCSLINRTNGDDDE